MGRITSMTALQLVLGYVYGLNLRLGLEIVFGPVMTILACQLDYIPAYTKDQLRHPVL